jgi:hypothetical protein
VNRWITAALLLAVWACLTAVLENPTEPEAATVALDLQDAITTAQLAHKDAK